jgi:hypothetical protein
MPDFWREAYDGVHRVLKSVGKSRRMKMIALAPLDLMLVAGSATGRHVQPQPATARLAPTVQG